MLLCGMAYAALAALCYYRLYADSVKSELLVRVSGRNEKSAFKAAVSREKAVLKLLARDFLKIHCPWSEETSIRYRVREARRMLRVMKHEGGWKAEDCNDPANHRQIAKDCFQPRLRFWAEELSTVLVMPVRLAFAIVLFVGALVIVSLLWGIKRLVQLAKKARPNQ